MTVENVMRYDRIVTGSSNNAKNRKNEWKIPAVVQAEINPEERHPQRVIVGLLVMHLEKAIPPRKLVTTDKE